MTMRQIAVLPLSSNAVVLLGRRTPSGKLTLAIPRASIGEVDDASALVRLSLGVEADTEALDDASPDEEISLHRARLPARARPVSECDADVVSMDFASFENAIAAGRISDLPTVAAWLRHRLLEGETTRRRRLTRPATWNPERLRMLADMWKDGSTGADIARRLGVTRNAVMGRIHRLGLSGQGGSVPLPARRDATLRREVLNEFEAAFGRAPVERRSGDDAMLVALSAMRSDRSPNVVSRLCGIETHRVMEILHAFHERGLWRSDDPPPERWSGDGRLLSMMVDAQLAYGIFRDQETR